jgi:hypothetical protein
LNGVRKGKLVASVNCDLTGMRREVHGLRLTPGVVLMLVGFLVALTACFLVLIGFRQVVTVIGVIGVIIFSIGLVVWHTEP